MIKSLLFSSEKSNTDFAILLLRTTMGILMMLHGWDKWTHFDTIIAKEQFPVIVISMQFSLVLAIFAELLMSAFIVIGVFTRLAAIPLIFTMLVAIFVVHLGGPIADRETAILFLIGFIVILFLGPGKYSIDAAIKK